LVAAAPIGQVEVLIRFGRVVKPSFNYRAEIKHEAMGDEREIKTRALNDPDFEPLWANIGKL